MSDRPPAARPRGVASKLAVMMALHYGGLGAWLVPFSGWLMADPGRGGLGFDAARTSWIYATLAIGGLLAPLVTGILADRTFASEKLVGVLQVLMAGLIFAAGRWAGAHAGDRADPAAAFGPLFWLMLAYSVGCQIAMTVANVLALRNLADPARSFGSVRLFGTFGWIVTAATVGQALNPLSAQPFDLAAGCHAVLGVFAFWLPHTPPKGSGRPLAEVVGLPAVKLFRDPGFVVYVVVASAVQLMQQFYTVFANPYFRDLGMWRPEVLMTLGQWCEIGCMVLIPVAVRRIGLKGTMALGLAGWVLRNAALWDGGLPAVVAVALPMHGLSYTFFTIVAALYIDREAPPHLRAGAQALVTFISLGPGTLAGNWVAGRVVEGYTAGGAIDWPAVWLVPLAGCGVALAVFVLLFREPKPDTRGDG